MSRPGQSLAAKLWLTLCLLMMFVDVAYARLQDTLTGDRIGFGLMFGGLLAVGLWLVAHDVAHRVRGEATHVLREAKHRE